MCVSCESLGTLPPMPLSDWPTTPGAGDTICQAGCRCVLQVSDDQLQPGDALPALSEDEEALVGRIAEAREPSAHTATAPPDRKAAASNRCLFAARSPRIPQSGSREAQGNMRVDARRSGNAASS